jgi:hypothetical protein
VYKAKNTISDFSKEEILKMISLNYNNLNLSELNIEINGNSIKLTPKTNSVYVLIGTQEPELITNLVDASTLTSDKAFLSKGNTATLTLKHRGEEIDITGYKTEAPSGYNVSSKDYVTQGPINITKGSEKAILSKNSTSNKLNFEYKTEFSEGVSFTIVAKYKIEGTKETQLGDANKNHEDYKDLEYEAKCTIALNGKSETISEVKDPITLISTTRPATVDAKFFGDENNTGQKKLADLGKYIYYGENYYVGDMPYYGSIAIEAVSGLDASMYQEPVLKDSPLQKFLTENKNYLAENKNYLAEDTNYYNAYYSPKSNEKVYGIQEVPTDNYAEFSGFYDSYTLSGFGVKDDNRSYTTDLKLFNNYNGENFLSYGTYDPHKHKEKHKEGLFFPSPSTLNIDTNDLIISNSDCTKIFENAVEKTGPNQYKVISNKVKYKYIGNRFQLKYTNNNESCSKSEECYYLKQSYFDDYNKKEIIYYKFVGAKGTDGTVGKDITLPKDIKDFDDVGRVFHQSSMMDTLDYAYNQTIYVTKKFKLYIEIVDIYALILPDDFEYIRFPGYFS